MNSSLARTAILTCQFAVLVLCAPARADDAAVPPGDGRRVFVAGHSFHVPIAAPLAEIARSAGLGGHALAGQQSIGGSTVTQHWDLPDERNKAKAAVRAGDVDVLTVSPFFALPDPAIDRFADLLLARNPAGRVTVQASWVPRDGVFAGGFRNADRDRADPAALRRAAAGYTDLARAQVRAINDRHAGKEQHAGDERHAGASKRPVALLVPTGEAVVRLRERVAAGEVPGIGRQSELFRDDLGHGTAVVNVLNAYCHFAVIYGRSPVGLPAPTALGKAGLGGHAAAANRVLQEVAWAAVLAEPASGVKEPARR